ncbi:hypothetical protein B7494_g7361 [Chlorociboria aeruginascens]|nr:hypothetical protein B7494_g7361 [Chlorociboria aeruginascens]
MTYYSQDPNSRRESDSNNLSYLGYSEAQYSHDNMGYYDAGDSENKYRDPNADNKYVDSKISNNGNEVIAHKQGRIDPDEPSSRDAEHSYHKSKKSSSHNHRSSKHQKEHKESYYR